MPGSNHNRIGYSLAHWKLSLMTDEQKYFWVLSFIKHLIGPPDQKGRGISEEGRILIALKIKHALE